MKVTNKRRIPIIGICLLAVVSVFLFLAARSAIKGNAAGGLTTESRDELKKVTLRICDEKGKGVTPITITDQEYMYSIYDHLSSIKTNAKTNGVCVEESFTLVLTYAYEYDADHSGKQDIILWGTDDTFYRQGCDGLVFGESAQLHELLTGLYENVELGLVSEGLDKPTGITVCKHDGADMKLAAAIEDTETIDRIYSYLQSVDTAAILYPSALSQWSLDTEYELILEYENQEKTTIFIGTETPDTFYRYSGTVSSGGEEGYIWGKNTELYELITALSDIQQSSIPDSVA